MHSKTLLLLVVLSTTIIFHSCKNKQPFIVKSELEPMKIDDVLAGNDQSLINLLNKVRGSVGKRGSGSKTIWSRKNEFELGLYISANHVYGLTGWSSRNAQFFELNTEKMGIFETSQIPQTNGNLALGNILIADFPLMHFDISPQATNTTILPEQDFYLGVIDNQRIVQEAVSKHPDVVQTSVPLQMYDPSSRTKAAQTWNTPIVGQKAIAVGYPQDSDKYPKGAVAYGIILSDLEAENIILQLKAAGDSEGDVPYRSTVEFFVSAEAIAGMSGGGVFNTDGQLLGIMVRSSDQEKAPKIIRVVKMSYIKSKMSAFYYGLPTINKRKIEPFISGEL